MGVIRRRAWERALERAGILAAGAILALVVALAAVQLLHRLVLP